MTRESNQQEFLRENSVLAETLNKIDDKDIRNIDDLLRAESYPEYIPKLNELLEENFSERMLRGLVRALTTKEAKGQAGPALMKLYHRLPSESNHSLLWAIGNAMSVVAGPNDYDGIVSILQDKIHHSERQMFCYALPLTKNSNGVNVLIGLLGDPDVEGHAIGGLRKYKATQAREKIEPYLKQEKTWIRNEAKKALAVFEREDSKKLRE